jgi:tRNA pseudouridine38-40 synthase
MRAFRVAYDGRPYRGFQRQPSVPTVEDAILDALGDLDVLAADGDTPPGYAAAGRTDAGVSALAQTVAFDAPDWLTPRALNAELPASVRAYASADIDPDFHATHDATSRAYDYHLHAPALDRDAAAAALAKLAGTHDFADLTARGDDADTVRTIETATIHPESTGASGPGTAVSRIHVRADGFLWELVRRLVALVHAVGTGERSLDAVDRALADEPLPDHERVGPAPPEPLVLSDVTYPGVAFETDPDAAASARQVFASERQTAIERTQVLGQLTDVTDGTDVSHGTDGTDVSHGTDGTDVSHGTDGTDVSHGTDGTDVSDGETR